MNNISFEFTLPELKIMHNVTRCCTPHFHSHIEILYVFCGYVHVMLDGRTYKVTAGDCLLIFPGAIHTYFDTSEDNDTLMIVCSRHLTGRWSEFLASGCTPDPVIPKSEMDPDSLYALRSITDKYDTRGPVGGWTSEEVQHTGILIQLFLSGFVSRLKLESRTHSIQEELSKKVINYIMQEYSNPITLDDIAHDLELNRFRVSRIFTNQLHISFSRFLNELRIEKAKKILAETDAPVTTIAFDCGFSSIRTFNRVFLDIAGISPRKFRRENNPKGLKG